MPYHYGDPSAMGYYGDDAYGFYAEPDTSGYGEPYYYGATDPAYGDYETVGYYAEPYGYYGEPQYSDHETVGYVADAPDLYGYYAESEPVGYYADERQYGYYGEPYEGYYGEPHTYEAYYGNNPEMVGYGAELEYPGIDTYGEPPLEGYVKDQPTHFNAGCPVPSNVSGYGEPEHLEGYVRPADVSPSCGQITPQPGGTPAVPETFRALWD